MKISDIGKMILFHRKISGLSRIELANLANVGKTVVYDIEHGKETVRLNTLWKVLDILNISIDFKSPLIDKFKTEQNEKI